MSRGGGARARARAVVFGCNVLSIILLMHFMNGTSPRQIRVYILMALANNYPSIHV